MSGQSSRKRGGSRVQQSTKRNGGPRSISLASRRNKANEANEQKVEVELSKREERARRFSATEQGGAEEGVVEEEEVEYEYVDEHGNKIDINEEDGVEYEFIEEGEDGQFQPVEEVPVPPPQPILPNPSIAKILPAHYTALLIRNLPLNSDSTDVIMNVFPNADIHSCNVYQNALKDGCYAQVIFPGEGEAEAYCEQLNGYQLRGYSMRMSVITIANKAAKLSGPLQPPPPPPPRLAPRKTASRVAASRVAASSSSSSSSLSPKVSFSPTLLIGGAASLSRTAKRGDGAKPFPVMKMVLKPPHSPPLNQPRSLLSSKSKPGGGGAGKKRQRQQSSLALKTAAKIPGAKKPKTTAGFFSPSFGRKVVAGQDSIKFTVTNKSSGSFSSAKPSEQLKVQKKNGTNKVIRRRAFTAGGPKSGGKTLVTNSNKKVTKKKKP